MTLPRHYPRPISTLKQSLHDHPILYLTCGAFFLLVTAYGFQAAGYQPCELCWWQRYPYFAVISIGIPFLIMNNKDNFSRHRIVLILFAFLFMMDLALAVFHIGVEQKLWQGLDTCSGLPDFSGLTIDQKLAQLNDTPPVPCDEASWVFWGLSMASYNAIAALLLFTYSLFSLVSLQKRIV